jgi:hypothetical protein
VTYNAWICSCGSDIQLEYQTSYTSNLAKNSSPSLFVSDTFETVDEMNSFMNKISPNAKLNGNEGSIFKGRVGFLCKFIEFYLKKSSGNGGHERCNIGISDEAGRGEDRRFEHIAKLRVVGEDEVVYIL